MNKFLELGLQKNSSPIPRFPPELAILVEKFGLNLDEIKRGQVEASVRVDFINPLLEHLGWDVRNSSGAPLSQRDVIYEPGQMIGGTLKAPDYALCISGARKLFVEAKRPSEKLEKNADHAFQLRKYSWSAGLPFGLLTDFEEYAIYDTSFAPQVGDSADVARVAYFTYKELENYWPSLYSIFSKDSVQSGSLEALGEESKFKKGEKKLDAAFLKLLKVWRLKLAQSIAHLNPGLDSEKVDFETQALINKIVFLRILEDRGLEVEGALLAIAESEGAFYNQLLSYIERADDRYNSGLFSGTGLGSWLSKDYPQPVQVGEEETKGFIRSLYFPNPFEFSVMPIEVLGQIYEFLLAEEVSFSDPIQRTVKIELKPEIRKKGGVFYTPREIVKYIVEETVGPLIKGKSYTEILKVKILDPAAGSGSFLVAVFDYLIGFVTDQQASLRSSKLLEYGLDGQLRLSTQERKKILLNCIHGVDIDAQAVAVCRLSLQLLLIENDSQQQFEFGHILPNLQNNIRAGNSLVGVDFDSALIREELESVYNPFDWESAFPEAFKQGGFDAVVGNPPYLNVDVVWGKQDRRLGYLRSHYPHIHTDKTDLLYYFLEKGSSLCKGELGFIVSRSFLEADKAQKLRGWLSQNTQVREILDFRNALVFPRIGINTAIVRLTKSLAVKNSFFKRWIANTLPTGYSAATLRDPANFQSVTVPTSKLAADVWNFGQDDVRSVVSKMDRMAKPWSKFSVVGRGMETGANKSFEVENDFVKKHPEVAPFVLPRATNSEIRRYSIETPRKLTLYLGGQSDFLRLPEVIQTHLESQREVLEGRAAFKRGNCEWWQFTFALHHELFKFPKIVTPYMGRETTFAPDFSASNFYSNDLAIIYLTDAEFPRYALLALMNSDIANFRFEYITKLKGGGQREYLPSQILKFPVPFTDAFDPLVQELEQIGKELCNLSTIQNSALLPDERIEIEGSMSILRTQAEVIIAKLYNLSDSDLDVINNHQH